MSVRDCKGILACMTDVADVCAPTAGAPREVEAGPADAGPEGMAAGQAIIPQIDGAWDWSPCDSAAEGLDGGATCCWTVITFSLSTV